MISILLFYRCGAGAVRFHKRVAKEENVGEKDHDRKGGSRTIGTRITEIGELMHNTEDREPVKCNDANGTEVNAIFKSQ